jgi:hypothetical protein
MNNAGNPIPFLISLKLTFIDDGLPPEEWRLKAKAAIREALADPGRLNEPGPFEGYDQRIAALIREVLEER